jgi:transposase
LTFVGLYHHPPERAVVLCVDEKSQIQALDRSAPVLPRMPGMPERRTHDYVRHGVTSLFAAFNIADGTGISALHRRHRATEFRRFLTRIDRAVPAELDVHLIADNYAIHKTPAIKTWLAAHPRFHLHFTPPAPPGSTRSNASSPTSPPNSCAAAPTAASGPRSRHPRLDPTGTPTPNRSSGPRPPKRSSTPSPDTADEFQAQDTRTADAARSAAGYVHRHATPEQSPP